MAKKINFEDVKISCAINERGGGMVIDLTRYGFKGHKMAAYQNYLGGGLLGKVCSNDTLKDRVLSEKRAAKLERIREDLKRYFHSLTNPESEWEHTSYEENQNMPVSGY